MLKDSFRRKSALIPVDHLFAGLFYFAATLWARVTKNPDNIGERMAIGAMLQFSIKFKHVIALNKRAMSELKEIVPIPCREAKLETCAAGFFYLTSFLQLRFPLGLSRSESQLTTYIHASLGTRLSVGLLPTEAKLKICGKLKGRRPSAKTRLGNPPERRVTVVFWTVIKPNVQPRHTHANRAKPDGSIRYTPNHRCRNRLPELMKLRFRCTANERSEISVDISVYDRTWYDHNRIAAEIWKNHNLRIVAKMGTKR